MNLDKIIIKGAREHNLKNIDLEIPKNKMIVITGVSGSGKSTLAFDTIYAEGQRRYVESLSAYARQFLDKMKKPKVDERMPTSFQHTFFALQRKLCQRQVTIFPNLKVQLSRQTSLLARLEKYFLNCVLWPLL
jgi:excinuclease UvrABC ATPase subunit